MKLAALQRAGAFEGGLAQVILDAPATEFAIDAVGVELRFDAAAL